MTKPYFSIVISLYNKSDYIEKTIKSILNQKFTDFEIIVVDDGSIDDGAEKVRGFVDSRLHLIRQENQGVSFARNHGLDKAIGKYVAFLDADDLWSENHLQYAADFFAVYPYIKWYASGWIRSCSPEIAQLSAAKKPIYFVTSYFKNGYKKVWTSAVIVETEFIRSIKGFSLSYSYGEDLHCWYRLAKKDESVGYTDATTCIYVDAESSLSKQNNGFLVKNWDFVLELLDNAKELSLIDAALYWFVRSRIAAYFEDHEFDALMCFLDNYRWVVSPMRYLLYKRIIKSPFNYRLKILLFKLLKKFGVF